MHNPKLKDLTPREKVRIIQALILRNKKEDERRSAGGKRGHGELKIWFEQMGYTFDDIRKVKDFHKTLNRSIARFGYTDETVFDFGGGESHLKKIRR